MDKINTLGDAIRVGSLKKPQCCGLKKTNSDFQIIATCALGSALDAINELDSDKNTLEACEILQERFNVDMSEIHLSPIKGVMGELKEVIVYLNDTTKWSREKIADWVDSVLGQEKTNFIQKSAELL